MTVKASILCAGLALGTTVNATEPYHKNDPACEKFSYKAMDFSKPVNRLTIGEQKTPVLEVLRDRGANTIIRYYDHPVETIDCKTLLDDELDTILAAGMSVAVVFQHHNDDPQTFLDGERGTRDALRALELAEANGQRYKSAIYFGVDGVDQALLDFAYEVNKHGQGEKLSDERRAAQGDKYANKYDAFRGYHARYFKDDRGNPLPVGKIGAKQIIPYVIEYFTQVKAVFDKASGGVPEKSYRIGAYGSGFVLEELTKKNLIDLKWLSMSRGYPGSLKYRSEEKWDLAQDVERECDWNYENKPGRVGVDGNIIKVGQSDFGQWSERRNQNVVPRPQKCPRYLPQ